MWPYVFNVTQRRTDKTLQKSLNEVSSYKCYFACHTWCTPFALDFAQMPKNEESFGETHPTTRESFLLKKSQARQEMCPRLEHYTKFRSVNREIGTIFTFFCTHRHTKFQLVIGRWTVTYTSYKNLNLSKWNMYVQTHVHKYGRLEKCMTPAAIFLVRYTSSPLFKSTCGVWWIKSKELSFLLWANRFHKINPALWFL